MTMDKVLNMVENSIQDTMIAVTDNVLEPRIELTNASTRSSSACDNRKVNTHSKRWEHTAIVTSLINASEGNVRYYKVLLLTKSSEDTTPLRKINCHS